MRRGGGGGGRGGRGGRGTQCVTSSVMYLFDRPLPSNPASGDLELAAVGCEAGGQREAWAEV